VAKKTTLQKIVQLQEKKDQKKTVNVTIVGNMAIYHMIVQIKKVQVKKHAILADNKDIYPKIVLKVEIVDQIMRIENAIHVGNMDTSQVIVHKGQEKMNAITVVKRDTDKQIALKVEEVAQEEEEVVTVAEEEEVETVILAEKKDICPEIVLKNKFS